MAEPKIPDATDQDTPLWRFVLSYYGGGGVSEACLMLQDKDHVDVNMMLFIMWSASEKRSLSRDGVAGLAARVTPWQAEVVAPIRAIRRMLKDAPPLVERAMAETFRNRIKAVELESERLQLDAMYALADGLSGSAPAATPRAAAQASVAAYESAAGRSFTPDAVETLLRRLETMESK